jgi:hypothetical protein
MGQKSCDLLENAVKGCSKASEKLASTGEFRYKNPSDS